MIDKELLKKAGAPITSTEEIANWLFDKHQIVIYDRIEPFVDPVETPSKILFRLGVKKCSLRDGWNGRIYIGESNLTPHRDFAKLQCIEMALKFIAEQKDKQKKPLEV